METPTRGRNEKKWLTAYLCSRTLAQYSTDRYAGGLYCRVRNGTGCDPAAMAVIPRPAMHIRYIMFFDSGLKIVPGCSPHSIHVCEIRYGAIDLSTHVIFR